MGGAGEKKLHKGSIRSEEKQSDRENRTLDTGKAGAFAGIREGRKIYI
jgi:hypothetical protein